MDKMNKKVFKLLFFSLSIIFIENKGMQESNEIERNEFTVSVIQKALRLIDKNEQNQEEVREKDRQEYIKKCNSSSVSCRPFCNSPSLEKNKSKASDFFRNIVLQKGIENSKKNRSKKKKKNSKKEEKQQEPNLIPLSRKRSSSNTILELPYTPYCSNYIFLSQGNVTGLIYKPIQILR